GLARGLVDELEHPLDPARLERAYLAEARHMPPRDHEQVDVGARIDVLDRDEAVAGPDVVTLAVQVAEEAVLRQPGSPPPRRPRLAPARVRPPARRRATASSRHRSRVQDDRRARHPPCRAWSASAPRKLRATPPAASRSAPSWSPPGSCPLPRFACPVAASTGRHGPWWSGQDPRPEA